MVDFVEWCGDCPVYEYGDCKAFGIAVTADEPSCDWARLAESIEDFKLKEEA